MNCKMCIVTCDSREDEDCDIVKLIYPDNDNTVGCISTKTNRKVRKDKKKNRANRPPRAKPRKQPLMELTNESIRKHQINDEGLATILLLKENNSSKPAINSVSNKNFESKFWFSPWELLHMKNGVLCYRWMENNCEKHKICTPKSLRDVVLWHIHDSETSGHLGIRRTYAKLMANFYYWPHMR